MKGFAAALVLLAAVTAGFAGSRPNPNPDPDLGRRIYREGLPGSAQPACASCHRRSGFGASEGGVYVPRVTGPALFQSGQLRRVDRFRDLYQEVQPAPYNSRLRDPRLRPAYTQETLAAAVREGRDPTGHWKAELECVVFGISAEAGLEIARRFEQNAIVFVTRGGVPELLYP